MKKKRIIFYLFLGILGAFGISLVLTNHFIDQKLVLSRLYDSVEKQTGKKLILNQVEFHLFPWPQITAQKIFLFNSANIKEIPFMTAARLKTTINLVSLLKKDVHFDSLYLDNVQVHLEVDEKGNKNWLFSTLKKDNFIPIKIEEKKDKMKWQMRLDAIQLTNVNCTFDDRVRHKWAQVHFNNVNINLSDIGKTHFDLEGDKHQASFKITGRLNWQDEETVSKWTPNHVPVKLQINLNEYIHKQNVASLHLNGYVKDFFNFKKYDLFLRGTVLDLNDINFLFPRAKLPPIQNVTFTSMVNDTYFDKDGKAHPQFQNLQFNSGQLTNQLNYKVENITLSSNSLKGPLTANVKGSIDNRLFKVKIQFDSFEKFQQLLWPGTSVYTPVAGSVEYGNILTDVKGILYKDKIKLVIDSHLNKFTYFSNSLGILKGDCTEFKGKFLLNLSSYKKLFLYTKANFLQNVNLSGTIKSSMIAIDTFNFDRFIAPIKLENGILSLKQFALTNAHDKIYASIVFPLFPSNGQILIQIHQSLIPMKWIENYLNLPSLYSGHVELSGKIIAKKGSPKQIAPRIDGQLAFVGSKGKLNVAGIKHFIGKTSENLPFGEGVDAKCLAILTTVQGNLIKFENFILDTDQFTLSGTGKVNMDYHTLNFHFIPRVYLGLFNVSTPINLTGTFSNPMAKFEKNKEKMFSLMINSMQKAKLNRPDYCSDALTKERALGQ
ncbi:hypothetical protein COMNV_01691 [Commensalibacter sp. Nvir]|uniref:AsmA family protein n=1 Tax=Commensalibacter sp. Nvir TaxID=3069817 RepID=UPI002D299B03|nr:hypothetical protein COMNV_01691 [Commensalibacter sp. Nvir]